MKPRKMYLQVREAIVRLKKQNKPIRDSKNFGSDHICSVVHSYIERMYWSAQEHQKWPGRPQKTVKVGDDRIISMVQKKTHKQTNLSQTALAFQLLIKWFDLKYKTDCRQTHRQAATEGGCNKCCVCISREQTQHFMMWIIDSHKLQRIFFKSLYLKCC